MRRAFRSCRCERFIAPLCAAVFCLAAMAGAGCASNSAATAGGDVEPPRFGSRLHELAQREAVRPATRSIEAPAPPGVDPSLLAPVDRDDADARLPFRQVVSLLTAKDDTPHVTDDESQSEDAITPPAALRRYVAARELRLSGDVRGAVQELEEAARLDPEAASPWRELGEAYLNIGDRLMAVAAFREALRRDPEDMRSLVQVGLATLDRRQHAEAAPLLARAWIKHESADPALRHIITMGLGRSLLEMGYINAGIEALTIAADLPERYGEATIYRNELAEVYRDRGDAWREIGDAATRLGRHDQALDAYDTASSFPTLDPGAIAPRRVNAAMQLGRPAVAAMVVLGEIVAARGQVEDRHMRLIEYLTRHGGSAAIGAAFSQAIAEIEASLPVEERVLASGRLARARAAALSGERALEILRARLAEAPTDESALADLYHRLDPDDAAGLLRQTIHLVRAAPLETPRYAAAMLRLRPSAERLIEVFPTLRLRGADADAGSLLLARLSEIAGHIDDATDELRRLVSSRPEYAPAVTALARTLARTGREGEALELLEGLDVGADAELRYASAIVLQSLGRFAEAKERLDPLLGDEAPIGDARRATIFLRAAEISLAMSDWGEARRLSERAVEFDPTLEDAYGFLIRLHGPGGPLADPRLLGDAVRQLRTAIPSSRTLRWLRAQDLVRAGQYDQAERELVSLAEEEPSRPVVELLVILWMRTGSGDRAEVWLQEKIEQRPTDSTPRLELARVLAARDKGDEAVATIEEWLEIRPNDLEAMRRLEAVLREALGRPDEADEMALRRLERSGAPTSLRDAMELAGILLRRDDIESAGEALLTGLRGGGGLGQDETQPLAQLAHTFAQRALADEFDVGQGVAILEGVLGRVTPAPLALHDDLLRLYARWTAPVDRMGPALERAVRQHEEYATDLTILLISLLTENDRLDDSLRLLEARVRNIEAPDVRILSLWVRLGMYAQNTEAVGAAIRATAQARQGERLIREFSRAPEQRWPEPRASAEFAYRIAQSFAFEGMADEADEVYRVALEVDPTHPMANNNLGYRMIERNEDLEAAYRMLRRAYAEEPDEYNIVDSIGWVRYKLGAFHDDVDEDGEVVREGAVTLLRKAADLIEKEAPDAATQYGRAIILDHLADSLWRIGEKEEAETHWRTSQSLLQALVMNQAIDIPEIHELSKTVDAKIEALDAGENPSTAPIAEEIENDIAEPTAGRSGREGR